MQIMFSVQCTFLKIEFRIKKVCKYKVYHVETITLDIVNVYLEISIQERYLSICINISFKS